MAKKAESPPLKGMKLPERDAVGKKAIVYLDARDAVEEAKKEMVRAGIELAAIMREKHRAKIKVRGVQVTLRHVEEDVLKVSKPKEN